MSEKKLKLYYCQWADDDDSTVAVIAHNIDEAKRLARKDDMMHTWFVEGCFQFTDLRCHWARKNTTVDLSSYKFPFVASCDDDKDCREYLKNGIYGGIMMECEKCHDSESICYYDKEKDKVLCSECADVPDEKVNP